MMALTKDIKVFIEALKDSEIVELSPDQSMIRQRIKVQQEDSEPKEMKQEDMPDKSQKEEMINKECEIKTESKENINSQ